MELKTLNEMSKPLESIKDKNPQLKVLIYWDIRQEAIKWIKAFNDCGADGEFNIPQVNKYDMGYDGLDLESWIKDFFNLTEEDLK